MNDNKKNNQYLLRIKNIDVLEEINSISKNTSFSKNDIINKCLEIALPIFKDKFLNDTTAITSSTDINDYLKAIYKKQNQLVKIAELLFSNIFVEQRISGAIYELLNFMISSSDSFPKLSEEWKRSIEINLPNQFEKMLQDFIAKSQKKE